MQLTKTNFIQYLQCPESLWLLKNKPDIYPEGDFSLFLQKLVKEGYEVEEYAKKLFPGGLDLPEYHNSKLTNDKLDENFKYYFQPSFLTKNGAFARVDILEKLNDNSYHIYEVKSSTSIKKDKKHNHLKDISFQKYVCQKSGLIISKLSIIYLNKNYIKNGDIIPEDLLIVENVTDEVNVIYESVCNEINSSIKFISKKSIDYNFCSCKFKTRTNHCDCFSFFNKNISNFSIYELNRISKKKINQLLEIGQSKIIDIKSDIKFSDYQNLQISSLINKKPIVNKENILKLFNELRYPLHFIDYETFPSAVPKINGLSPHKQHVFQVSIHTLSHEGNLTHFEFLADKIELKDNMLTEMKKFTGLLGTFISWHASFEISRNKDMINWFPNFSNYLSYINLNMFDLEIIFKKYYIDYKFNGSSSIKKVLPIICPNLSYSDLEVSNGTIALDLWGRMVLDSNFDQEIAQTRKNLLKYCELDTKAMVEIFLNLKDFINH